MQNDIFIAFSKELDFQRWRSARCTRNLLPFKIKYEIMLLLLLSLFKTDRQRIKLRNCPAATARHRPFLDLCSVNCNDTEATATAVEHGRGFV